MPDDPRLGQELLKASLISESQLKTALEYQASLGGQLVDIVVKLGFVDEGRLDALLAPVADRGENEEGLSTSGSEQPQLIDELLGRIADPAVAALARALVEEGILDATRWQRALEPVPSK